MAMAGERSLLGDESREDGLDESEWGDMGLASGEAPWWSEDRERRGVGTRSRSKGGGGGGGGLAHLQGSSATAWWPRPI